LFSGHVLFLQSWISVLFVLWASQPFNNAFVSYLQLFTV
jgi:hypothetical protein